MTSSCILCILLLTFPLRDVFSENTAVENESRHLCSCSPRLFCGGAGQGGGPETSRAGEEENRRVIERLSSLERKYDELLETLQGINSTEKLVNNSWQIHRCDIDTVVTSPDSLLLDGTFQTTPGDTFCQALASTLVEGSTYEISVDIFNKQGRGGVTNLGHPGVFFNAKDPENFDLIYFRPHSASGCYQTGYRENDSWKGTQQGRCSQGPPAGATWFNVKVKVDHYNVRVFLDDQPVISFVSHFLARGQGGVFLWNGYENVALFRNYAIVRS